jgi:hypothetical protein
MASRASTITPLSVPTVNMPEMWLWFQWRVGGIVKVEAGANMAARRLNPADRDIFRPRCCVVRRVTP